MALDRHITVWLDRMHGGLRQVTIAANETELGVGTYCPPLRQIVNFSGRMAKGKKALSADEVTRANDIARDRWGDSYE